MPPAAFDPSHAAGTSAFDPFRICVYTTIALLAWLLTPPFVVSVLSGMALVTYYRARRAGLARSRCKLGDTRLVMAYLAAAFIAGAWFTAAGLLARL